MKIEEGEGKLQRNKKGGGDKNMRTQRYVGGEQKGDLVEL